MSSRGRAAPNGFDLDDDREACGAGAASGEGAAAAAAAAAESVVEPEATGIAGGAAELLLDMLWFELVALWVRPLKSSAFHLPSFGC